jgi:uncharacterized membrane protein YjfL (UPF0719 family)
MDGSRSPLANATNGSIIVRSTGWVPELPEGKCALAKDGKVGMGPNSAQRWHMSPMFGLLVAWGVLTGVLIILLIYKSTLTMHEDDSIMLNETESQMQKDQAEVLAKMRKLAPIVKVLGALSGAMILVIAGLFIYQGLNIATTPQ